MAGSLYLGSQKVCPAIVANEPVISSLNVTPSTSEQTIEAPSGTDGYNPINVSAVTSSIDSNIIPENIKKDVTILNVTGTLDGGGESVRNGLEPDQNGKLSWVTSGNLVFSGFTDVGKGIFYEVFSQSEITSVDLSNLETISGNQACTYMLEYCSQLTSADLSNLKTISGNSACLGMFEYCSQLTSADLSSLETISGSQSCSGMFNNCSQLTSADLSNLKTINGNFACGSMFAICSQLASADLSGLETISGSNACTNMFTRCVLLASLRFSSLKTILNTNALTGLINGCSGVTIHIPSNMESTIQGLTGYPNFGGTDTTLLFDLPPTA